MRRYIRQINALVVLLLLLSMLQPELYARAAFDVPPVSGYGQIMDSRQTELAPDANYIWMDVQDARGRQKIHAVQFNPGSDHLELHAGTKSGTVYGMEPLTEMAAYADKPGNRVIAGINGDFYEISGYATGVPNGLFMDEGVILNSGTSSYAFGLTADGRSLYGKPVLQKNITIGGQTSYLTSINRLRGENQLVLFAPDYSASTKSSNDGDEFVLDVLEGEVKSGQTMRLKVAEVRLNQGDTPLREGQVVLSASGDKRTLTQGLKAGDELSASFALEGEWSEAELAIGGQGPLVKDGVVQTGVGPSGVHPRTAIGTKADGSIVLFEVDGRAPGFSEGMETAELASIMQEMGVVNAMNLDGGGSSTLVARMPGTEGVQMMNQGSDGYERKIGNGLLLVNTAPEEPAASRLAVQPGAERILQGASFTFKAAGIDANGHPAPYQGELSWEVDPALGTMDSSGVFTAGQTAGTGTVRASAGNAAGTAQIEVVDKLTALEFPDQVKTYSNGEKAVLSVKALRSGQTIQAGNDSFAWRVEGDIGTVDEHGVFTATDQNAAKGKIYVTYGNVEASFEVNVGLPPVMLEDFEDGIGSYKASSTLANHVSISEVTDPDYVRGGSRAVKLEYDFTGTTGTSGAYLTATSTDSRIQIPGYPEKISMWVYGDGQKHWLRGQLRDGANAAIPVNFTEQNIGVDWTGWKYVEVEVPKGKTTPLTMDMPVRYMETKNTNKTAGAIYIDDIRAIYGPLEEDRTPPIFKDMVPASNEMVKTGTPTISVTAEDDGYDPVQHPGTTLIDPDTIRVYIDGQQVEYGFYPPKGQISYKPKTPLTEGRHKVKVAVRDLSGNQTIQEWYFTVNLGSPFYVYDTPDTLYAGQTYTLDIFAEKAAELKEGHVAFRFDPAAVSELEVVRGSKVSEAQLVPKIEGDTVTLELHGLNEAGLADDELIGQIRYKVRSDYIGPHTLEEAAQPLSKPLTIAFASGSVTSTKGAGQPISFTGADVEAIVRTKLNLNWDPYEIAQGYEASFTVTGEDGAAAEGAKLLLDGVEVPRAAADAAGVLRTDLATRSSGTFTLQAVKGDEYSAVMTFKVAEYAGTADPRSINVTMGADAARERHFTWHTDPMTTDTMVELVKRSEFTDFEADNVTRVNGSNSLYNTNNDGTIRVHKAEAKGLEPDTEYVYRVGDGSSHMSTQGTFRTSGMAGDTTKFLFIGDSQAGDQAGFGLWGQTLDKAFEDMPDVDMLVHAGDMVDKGFEQEQWDWWFDAAQDELMNTTLVPLVGNHEVMGSNGNGDYLAQFHNPQNGPDGTRGSSFSFDINDTHFVVLNTEGSAASYEEQARWLDEDLSNTDRKWKVLFFHQGPYGSIYANERAQQVWVPVFDKHHVDLAMNGHDHIYMRSYPMENGGIVPDGQGTRYVIGGSSGPKFYALTERFWQEKIYDEDEQIFTGVEITDEAITVTAKTLDGTEIDRFTIGGARPESLQVLPETAELAPGETLALKAVVKPDNASVQKIIWSVDQSGPDSAVSVDEQGLVTAVKPGSATVTAAVYGYPEISAKSIITVAGSLSGIEVKGKQQLVPGGTDRVIVEAMYPSGSRKALTEGVKYASSDENVAAIDQNGTVTAKAQGATVISATYQGLTDSYNLRVVRAADGIRGIEIHGPAELEAGERGKVVAEAVYGDGSRYLLAEGVFFESSNESVAEFDHTGTLNAVREGTTVISAVYESWSADYLLTVTSGPSEPTPTPTPSPDRDRDKDRPSGGTAGGAAPAPAPAPTPPAADDAVVITPEQLAARGSDGAAIVAIGEDIRQVLLPGNAADLLNGAPLRITAADVQLEIPAAVLSELAGQLPSGPSAAAWISVLAVPVADDERLMTELSTHTGARVSAAGLVRNWSMSIMDAAGKSFTLDTFSEPLQVSFAADAAADRELTAIYRIAEDGSFEYVGGKWDGERIAAEIRQPGIYAVLEYDKSFADLASGHWAERVVKRLAARQLIEGVSADRFEPGREVTRAEFITMLVRVLGLEGQHTEPVFTDIQAGSWYAEAVSLASQAGLVQGTGAALFQPERTITRQEMAAMLVRAYEYAADNSANEAKGSSFSDLEPAPSWARTAAGRAGQLGLMQGRGQGQFQPLATGTRAESAQMVLNLLERMEQQ
ncbi:phosphodiester glycosidase family protein [Paenibacillus jiagnxiensis]|uniref:phosphodiester glycosidase family protein n=1 Tax=Paenibacillus jiagnxiensis TaxID=3228926 RepID=UPI0033B4FA22